MSLDSELSVIDFLRDMSLTHRDYLNVPASLGVNQSVERTSRENLLNVDAVDSLFDH